MKKSFKGFIACLLALLLVIPAFTGMAEAIPQADAAIGGSAARETVSRAFGERETALQSKNTVSYDLSGIRNGRTFKAAEAEATPAIDPDSIVTIMVELDAAPAADVVSDLRAANGYREQLVAEQNAMIAKIDRALGIEIVPTHHYSVLFNGFAFEGAYRLVAEIDAMDGAHAFVSPEWETPELFNTVDQVGATAAWELGYTGEGYAVAILDTGCKVNHPAFSTDPEGVMFTRDDIAAIIASGQLQGSGNTMNVNNVYVSAKIPFQWNYYYNHADASHPGTSDHGTHVAGIAAGNGGEIRGVAPEAQLCIMQVFAPSGGASWSNIVPALEDAAVLGVAAANLSLGSACGNEVPYDPSITATLERCVAAGVNLAMSAGNDYDSTFNNAWGGNEGTPSSYSNSGYGLSLDPDLGVTGSPASWPTGLSVAAVNNTKQRFYYITVEGNDYSYSENSDNAFYLRNVLGGQTVEYVPVPGFGTVEDFAQVDVSGKVALVSRGEINFVDKAANAEAAGAVACVVYNNQDAAVNMVAYEGGHIPHVIINKAAGQALLAAGEKQMFVDQELGIFDSPTGNMTTSFSSRGPLANLAIKPEITAPGGSIYSSTDPAISGVWYDTWDGTSMSSPHVAGGMAIVTEYVDVNFPNASAAEKQHLVTQILMSTARPILSDSGEYAPVHEQGAGLMDLEAATTTKAYLTVEGTNCERPKLELGDDPEKTGAFSMTFKVHNFGDAEQVYTLAPTVLLNDIALLGYMDEAQEEPVIVFYGGTYRISGSGDYVLLGDANHSGNINIADAILVLRMAMGLIEKDPLCDVNDSGSVNVADAILVLRVAMGVLDPIYGGEPSEVDFDMPDAVTVPAGGEAEVTINAQLSDYIMNYINAYYPNGALLEGFVELIPEGEDDVDLSIPFIKYFGDWNYPATVDRGYYYQDVLWNSNNYPNTIGWKKGGTIYGLGINPYVETADLSYYLEDRNAISPNEDGIMDTVNVMYMGLLRNSFVRYIVLDENGNEIDTLSNIGLTNKGFWKDTARKQLGITEGIFPSGVNFAQYNKDEIVIRIEAKLDNNGAHGTNSFDINASECWKWDVPVSIDVNAPTASNASANGNELTLDVTDDRYVAYVATCAYVSESELGDLIAEQGLFETERGVTSTVTLPAAAQCYVIVADYAMNEIVYLWNGQELIVAEGVLPAEPTVDVPDCSLYCYGKNLNSKTWVRFSTSNLSSLFYAGGINSDTEDYSCGTYTGEYVYAISANNQLIRYEASDLSSWTAKTTVGNIQSPGYAMHEMAYDASTDTLYVVAGVGGLYVLDTQTCQLTECPDPQYGIVAMDFDANGNCYIVDAYGYLCEYDVNSGNEIREICETGITPVDMQQGSFVPQCGTFLNGVFLWFSSSYNVEYYSDMHLIAMDVTNGAMRDMGNVYGGLYCLGLFSGWIDVPEPTVNHEDFYDNFENAFGWEVFDADGDGLNWGTDYFDQGQYQDGSKCAVSYSYTQENGAFEPNNYMISPAFTVGENRFLSFFTSTANYSPTADIYEHYAVYVIPEGGDYLTAEPIFETTMDDYRCTEHVIDLSAFAGQSVQLVFRHFDCYDQYTLLIDAVAVGTAK